MTGRWRRLPLHLQLALVSALLLCASILVATVHNARQNEKALIAQLQENLTTLARNLALTGRQPIEQRDAAGLAALLGGAASFREIRRIQVVVPTGETLSDIARRDDGALVPHAGGRRTPIPSAVQVSERPAIERSEEALAVWFPVGEPVLAGWIRIEAGLQEVNRRSYEIWRHNLLGAMLAVGVNVTLLLWTLHGPQRALDDAVRFARALSRDGGDGLRLEPSAREIDQLVAALNEASQRISAQRGELERKNAELTGLNATLEHRVAARTAALERANERLTVENRHRRATEEQLRTLSQAVEQSPVSVLITDPRGVIEYVNPHFTEVTGYAAEEAIGQTPSLLKSGLVPVQSYRELWHAISGGQRWRGELINRKKNGELLWEAVSISPVRSPQGQITHFLALNEDISQRKRYEEQLLKQAHYDNLTQLPNRALAMDRLDQALMRGRRLYFKTALMFLNLDHFKGVNDRFGHDLGDRLLQECAQRLASVVREGDTLARLGGDEFLIVLPEIKQPANADTLAAKILARLEPPYLLDGREAAVSASLGIAIAPDDTDSGQELLRSAGAAMYRAKESGRATYRFYAAQMNEQVQARLAVDALLQRALERDELFLAYHPIVRLGSSRLVATEALLRWRNAELGLISPARFIPIAEQNAQILSIGEWTLNQATRTIAGLNRERRTPLAVSVNVAGRQLHDPRFPDRVVAALEASGLAPELLHLEVAEALLMEESIEITGVLRQIAGLGVRIAIDDFGTGQVALGYLQRVPSAYLKIDHSLVRDLELDAERAGLVRTIIRTGHGLGMELIAEGVETRTQQEILGDYGCDLGQGYLFTHPLQEQGFAEYAAQHRDA